MSLDTTMVLQWLDERNRLLHLIAAKVGEEEMMTLAVARCRNSDSRLREEVALERLSRKPEDIEGE